VCLLSRENTKNGSCKKKSDTPSSSTWVSPMGDKIVDISFWFGPGDAIDDSARSVNDGDVPGTKNVGTLLEPCRG
jgi:hypothetical protein